MISSMSGGYRFTIAPKRQIEQNDQLEVMGDTNGRNEFCLPTGFGDTGGRNELRPYISVANAVL
jgi:hypothetical protein